LHNEPVDSHTTTLEPHNNTREKPPKTPPFYPSEREEINEREETTSCSGAKPPKPDHHLIKPSEREERTPRSGDKEALHLHNELLSLRIIAFPSLSFHSVD
jgi:hypothetical protein